MSPETKQDHFNAGYPWGASASSLRFKFLVECGWWERGRRLFDGIGENEFFGYDLIRCILFVCAASRDVSEVIAR